MPVAINITPFYPGRRIVVPDILPCSWI